MPPTRLLHHTRREARRPTARHDVVVKHWRDVAWKENERLFGKIRERETRAGREPMPARNRRHKWLVMHALEAKPTIRIRGRTLQNSEVDAPIAQCFCLLGRIHLEERESDRWQVHAKESEYIRQNPGVRRGVDEADAESSRFSP
jgi:hypothetical protein